QYNRHDPTFRGITGFPYSSQALEAIGEFTGRWWGKLAVPIVSPSATSNQLSNIPNFYRVSSSDSRQAWVMANFICNTLKPTQSDKDAAIDIFTNSDPYSSSLSSEFDSSLPPDCFGKIRHDLYQNGNAASIQQAAQNAMQSGCRYIFFPGYEGDL